MQAYEMKIFEMTINAAGTLSEGAQFLLDFGRFASRFCGDDHLAGRAYITSDLRGEASVLFAADYDLDVVMDAWRGHSDGIYGMPRITVCSVWFGPNEARIKARYKAVGELAAELYRSALKRKGKGVDVQGTTTAAATPAEEKAAKTDEFTCACCAIAEAVERGADDGVRSAEDLADLAKALKIAVEAEMMRREMDKYEAKAR